MKEKKITKKKTASKSVSAAKKTISSASKTATRKKTTATKKVAKPKVTKKVESVKTNNVKEIVNDVKPKEKNTADKRYLVVGIIYLLCAFLWIIGGSCKLMVKESYLFDMILGFIWLALSFVYFKRYAKDKK